MADTPLVLLISIVLLVVLLYSTFKTFKRDNSINGVLGFAGAILLIFLSMWSLHAGSTDKRVLLSAFIVFAGSMWITGILGLVSGKKFKLHFFDVVLIVLYLPAFLFVGQMNGSLLSSALSMSFYYITTAFYNALKPDTPSKHTTLFKIILWLWFLIMGIVFKGTVAL